MFHVAGKAVLAARIGPALGLQPAAGQFAGVGEKDRRMPPPDRRVRLPEHFGPGALVDGADRLGPVAVHGQAQFVIFDRITHKDTS